MDWLVVNRQMGESAKLVELGVTFAKEAKDLNFFVMAWLLRVTSHFIPGFMNLGCVHSGHETV